MNGRQAGWKKHSHSVDWKPTNQPSILHYFPFFFVAAFTEPGFRKSFHRLILPRLLLLMFGIYVYGHFLAFSIFPRKKKNNYYLISLGVIPARSVPPTSPPRPCFERGKIFAHPSAPHFEGTVGLKRRNFVFIWSYHGSWA